MAAAVAQAAPGGLELLKAKACSIFAPAMSAFAGVSLPVKAGIGLAVVAFVLALIRMELTKRDKVIQAGEDCMSGSDDACELYDASVDATPVWKLRLAINKLANTNLLANKLAGPPPAGFKWAGTY